MELKATIIILIIVSAISLIGNILLASIIYESRYIERLTMYNKTYSIRDTYYNGLYFANTHFCVWTKDRTADEIKDTYNHEMCHAILNEDYDHFCVDEKFWCYEEVKNENKN